MSISAMNWPNAMIPKIRNFVRSGSAIGSIGGREGAGAADSTIVIRLRRSLYYVRHINGVYKAMRYGEDHKEQTRARVLQEAAREIRAKGPDGIGVAAIMARAGLTHGGFYAHFKSKDALVAAALDTMFEDMRARFERRASDADPRTALRAYVDFYLSAMHRDARDRGCP